MKSYKTSLLNANIMPTATLGIDNYSSRVYNIDVIKKIINLWTMKTLHNPLYEILAFGLIIVLALLYASWNPFGQGNNYPDIPTDTYALNAHPSQVDPLTTYQIFKDVNAERAKAGVAPLNVNPALVTSAQQKCNDMVVNNYYGHDNPTSGKHGYDWITDNLPTAYFEDENLNQGPAKTGQDFVSNWLTSPAHKEAMLSNKYTDTGIALCSEGGLPTVVQHFASIKG